MTIVQRYDPAVPIDQLLEHPDNPRVGDEDAIDASMERHGFYGAVYVQASTNFIVAGNHRTRVARRRGETTLPVIYMDLDDDQARRILLVDNRSADTARYDERELMRLLAEMGESDGGFDGTGFDETDLARLLGKWGSPGDPNHVPEPPRKPRSKRGDLYELGRHRLLCGDSTNAEHVERVLGGHRPRLMVTDPPYLVDYTGRDHPRSNTNRGDPGKNWDTYIDPASSIEFYDTFMRHALAHLEPGSAIYQWHATRRANVVEAAWAANKLLWHQTVYWYKTRPVLTHSDFMWAVEVAAYGWQVDDDTGPAFAGQLDEAAYGWKMGARPPIGRRPPLGTTNVWQLPAGTDDPDVQHPTIKPLQVYTDPYTWHIKPGEWAYEPFSGSGTAIAAAEVTGRCAAAIDQQPAYIDVACLRWQRLTGQLPVLDGNPIDFEVGR